MNDKMNEEELKNRINTCVKFLTRALDKSSLEFENEKFKDDFNGLGRIVVQMSMYLAEFNFYPSEYFNHCCQVAFFTSLSGQRWNLNESERISFDQMFKLLIRHCQGTCAGRTTYAVLILDNWDDDIATFWEPNLNRLKQNGVIVQVRLMMGSQSNVYEI